MYNLVVIGTSQIAEEFSMTVTQISKINKYGVCSRSEERAIEFANENNFSSVFTKYDDVLNDSKVDIVYIATPNKMHFEQAKMALEMGKNVIVEKPISLKVCEAEKLFEIAKERNVKLMEAIVFLMNPIYIKLKEYKNKIGDIKKIDFNMMQQTRHYKDYTSGKYVTIFDGENGGGATRDLGPYVIYPLIDLFGEPICININSEKNSMGADETTQYICKYSTFDAILSMSKVIYNPNKNIILGTKGCIIIDKFNDLKNITLTDVKGNVLENMCIDEIRMQYEIEHFIRCLENKEQVFKDVSILGTKLIEANYIK